MVDIKKVHEFLIPVSKVDLDLTLKESDLSITRKRRGQRDAFPVEDVESEIPQRVLNDPVRKASLEGCEVYPDEIFTSVFADEIAAAPTIEPDPNEESDLGDL